MNKKILLTLFVIILIASILRLWQLGKVPSSPDWDEAALGYNAYAILHTGRDEYGTFLPVVLRSFNDYKPALYTYLCIPAIMLFDLTVFSVRLPSAIIGIITVIATFFLVYELTKQYGLALIASFLLAVSPWHIQFSRVAFETNIGLGCNIFGILFFLKGFKKPRYLLFSATFFALAIYAYQSEKVFTPLIAVILISIYRKKLFKISKFYLLGAFLLGLIIVLPIVYFTATNKLALTRIQGVSIFTQSQYYLEESSIKYADDLHRHDIIGQIFDNRRVIFGKEILANYFAHFNLNWLFLTGDIERHHAPESGLLYIVELPFFIFGIYQLLFGPLSKGSKVFIVCWFLSAAVPASITSGVPHAVRTLNFLPVFQIFTAFGIFGFVRLISQSKIKRFTYPISAIGMLVFLFNFIYYLDQYFIQTNYYNPFYWQYGYEKAIVQTKDLADNYNEVIVSNTNYLDQSYIFFLFYLKYEPSVYIKNPDRNLADIYKTHNFGKFTFRPINWQDDKNRHALFIGNPNEFPDNLQNYKVNTIISDSIGDKVIEIVGI